MNHLSAHRQILLISGTFSLLLLALWFFPLAWYTRTSSNQQYFWLTERTNLTGWAYHQVPVAESAEAILVADRLVNGEFTNSIGKAVRVFSAKRYQEKQNEIGLFVHTPDRCWTESGWKLEPAAPEMIELELHGTKILFERRIFTVGAQRELVYFAGLTGGQPLPYRLDHNLSVGMKHQLALARDKTGTTLRGSDQRLWTRVWESFASRRPLLGPKQFLRISTPVNPANLSDGDRLIQEFLSQWLSPSDYHQELAHWQNSPNSTEPKS